MTTRRLPVLALLAALCLAGVSVVADALVLTDEERLEGFVERLMEASAGARVDVAVAHSRPDRVEVEVSTDEGRARYGEGDEVELADHLEQALADLEDQELELLQETIEIEGEHALVAVRVDAPSGPVDAQFRFVRRGDGWLLSRVRVL